jgi:hypothetical protein
VGNQNSPDHSTWFRTPVVSLIGGPPIFSCFEEFAREVLKKSESAPLQSLTLSLGVTSPKPQPAPSSSAGWRSSVPAPMAYRRVDPEPFLPPGFSASVVLHREIMARSVTRHLPPLHEDWAIISIQPLPDHEITFPAVRDVVREYLVSTDGLGCAISSGRTWVRFWFSLAACLKETILSCSVRNNTSMLPSLLSGITMLGIIEPFSLIGNAGLCCWVSLWITVHQNTCRRLLALLAD